MAEAQIDATNPGVGDIEAVYEHAEERGKIANAFMRYLPLLLLAVAWEDGGAARTGLDHRAAAACPT